MCLTISSHWKCGHSTHKSIDLFVKARFSSSKSQCIQTNKIETRHRVCNGCKFKSGMGAANEANAQGGIGWREKRALKAKAAAEARKREKGRKRLIGKEVVKKVKKEKLSDVKVTEEDDEAEEGRESTSTPQTSAQDEFDLELSQDAAGSVHDG